MMATNYTENFKYRIIGDEVFELDVIHASATISREDNTFGFSYINFSENFNEFNILFFTYKNYLLIDILCDY